MSTAIAQREQEPKFIAMLESAEARIKAVLPPDVDPNRFVQTMISTYNRTPDLQACTPRSVIQSLIRAAEIGLVPNTALGHAYLVPFRSKQRDGNRDVWIKEAQLVVGYKGLIYLACRSGFFSAVDAREVNHADRFRLVYTPRPVFEHEPCLGGDAGPATHYYAYAVTRDKEVVLEVMDRAEIDKIRMASPSKESPAWRNWFDEMAKKTVVKRLLKDQPCGDRFTAAMAAEDEYEALAAAKASPRSVGGGSRADDLAARLEAPLRRDEPTEDEILDDLAAAEGGRDED